MKVAVIGAGNMGGAITRGLVHSNLFCASNVSVADPLATNLDMLKCDCPNIMTSTSNADAVKNADIVVFAVKPWLMQQVVSEVVAAMDCSRQILVSIAAGISIGDISNWITSHVDKPVIFRAMPNTAIAVHQSMTFICHNTNATDKQIEKVSSIFDALGKVAVIEERLMPVATALCSCGIAYAMRYVRAATEGGIELGMYAGSAKDYVLQTMRGAIELLEATGNNPEVEIDKVSTPGGVTIKGLNAMESAGFTASVVSGLKASCK